MEDGHIGGDAVGEQFINQPVVVVQPLRIRGAGPFREHARPGDGKAVRLYAERLHQLNILFVERVLRRADQRDVVVGDGAGLSAEIQPVRRPRVVRFKMPFDLKRGGGGAPQKMFRHAVIHKKTPFSGGSFEYH